MRTNENPSIFTLLNSIKLISIFIFTWVDSVIAHPDRVSVVLQFHGSLFVEIYRWEENKILAILIGSFETGKIVEKRKGFLLWMEKNNKKRKGKGRRPLFPVQFTRFIIFFSK